MPLGSSDLVRAHIRGLRRAAQATGRTAPVQLSVRNLSDPLEAAALRKLTDEDGADGAVEPGMYVSSPRGAVGIEALIRDVPVAWVELRLLHAAMFGLRPKHLLTGEPIDGYLKDGLLSEDPRTGIAAAVLPLLGATGSASAAGARVGVRVSGHVAEDTVAVLLRLGVRRFAVDLDETYPAWVALGRAATA
jgi:pyruvate,orthophosphate dikinase